MFRKILIANRGEIACRVIKTARKMGIKTVAVYSDADREALHVTMADEAVHIGPSPAAQSYIVIDNVLKAIKETGADAVHPGYGFLSERADFAKALEAIGVAFIGPPVGAIESMGDKIESKKLADKAGVSTVPGVMGVIKDTQEAVKIARQIGFPVMMKASAGGGGKGMRIAWNETDVEEGFTSAMNEARSSFGDDRVFIEKFITNPRHIEIQVLGDKHGNTIYLGERECSIQRRNQKVIEEAPSAFLDETTRQAMGEQAVRLARAVEYCSAGTVEFIVDENKNFYFLEMNTRLQVEHPVTELITGVDLVEQMIRVAYGEKLTLSQADIKLTGWAIESRIYAEDPYRNFLPSIGRLVRYSPPQEGETDNGALVRNDTGVEEGGEISMHYDPMIAKLCTWADNRDAATQAMAEALDRFELEGIGHNVPFLCALMAHPRWRSGDISTAFIAQEYPEGFEGCILETKTLELIAATLAAMGHREALRNSDIEGTLGGRKILPSSEGCVLIEGQGERQNFPFVLKYDSEHSAYHIYVKDKTLSLDLDWQPGESLARAEIGAERLVLKVEPARLGYRVRYRGAEFCAMPLHPRAASLYDFMPEKQVLDTSKQLLCPMPGLIVSIKVKEGESVEEGQALAVVEAMKMENILRAERKTKVVKIHAQEGDSLQVDALIMEFA